MKFVIGKPIKPDYVSQFVLEVNWMHGDADAYTTDTFAFGEFATKELEEHVEFLNQLMPLFQGGMGGSDTYARELKRKGIKVSDILLDTIPCDQYSCYGDAAFESFKLFWYEENSVKHEVVIK